MTSQGHCRGEPDCLDGDGRGCQYPYCLVHELCGCMTKPREMVLGDLYSYRTHGWHQFGWPVLPVEWYATL